MEKEPRTEVHWAHKEYPDPIEVLEAALTRIEENGSVMFFDAEENEWYAREPHEPVPVDELPPDVYSTHLIRMARNISYTCNQIGAHRIGNRFIDLDWELRSLAHSLTAYRHNRSFLERAAQLRRLDQSGFWVAPQLPRKPAWEWVPLIRP